MQENSKYIIGFIAALTIVVMMEQIIDRKIKSYVKIIEYRLEQCEQREK